MFDDNEHQGLDSFEATLEGTLDDGSQVYSGNQKDSINVWCACDNRTGLNSLGNLFHNQHFRTASGADRMTGEHDDAIA